MRTDDRTEEQVLIMRAQRGEQEAFRILVERYQGLVFTLAKRLVKQTEDAEDIAQEVFLKAWKGLPNFRMDAAFSTWLYRLTTNAATDLLRKRKKEQEDSSLDDEENPIQVEDPKPGPEDLTEAGQRKELLNQALMELSENHRKILVLREVNGLSYDEIGEILELSPGTVKSRIARARLELREKLLRHGNIFSGFTSKKQMGGEGK